jgi:hypothetical protein
MFWDVLGFQDVTSLHLRFVAVKISKIWDDGIDPEGIQEA